MHTFVHTYILLHGASEKGQLLRRGGNTTTATVLASKNEQATKTTHDTHTHTCTYTPTWTLMTTWRIGWLNNNAIVLLSWLQGLYPYPLQLFILLPLYCPATASTAAGRRTTTTSYTTTSITTTANSSTTTTTTTTLLPLLPLLALLPPLPLSIRTTHYMTTPTNNYYRR